MNKKTIFILIGTIVGIALIIGSLFFLNNKKEQEAKEAAMNNWVSTIEKQNFEKLPTFVTTRSLKEHGYTSEELVNKYSTIFSGIGVDEVKITNIQMKDNSFTYAMQLNTAIGQTTTFNYEAQLSEDNDRYKINWHPALIFPNMEADDKISFNSTSAKRGDIKDANDFALATFAKAFQAGIIPGELGNDSERDKNMKAISKFLEMPVDTIEANLAKSWVKDDLFVPLKTIADEDVKKLTGLQYKAVETRYYPLGEAAANLIGYTGKVTAEDLEKNPSLGMDSTIGKSGLERSYDKELRGVDGGEIALTDAAGKVKDVLLTSEVEDGQDIKLTIDHLVQKRAYSSLKDAAGSTVVMEPKTGALISLVTKPSFDPNEMVRGISQESYDQYANNPDKPFMSRYALGYAPGSTMKAITAAVALDAGTLTEKTMRKIDGLQWQKDGSWGNYKITRVTDNPEVDFVKALVYSDNIFFAQEGLALGEKELRAGFDKFGFGKEYELPFAMEPAQISTDKKFANDILLADTAYGQGQLLMSPIQQAVAFSAFANEGKIVSPHLVFQEKSQQTQAATAPSIEKVNAALLKVVSDKNGTAHLLNSISPTLAAKTGTAELKMEQGTEGQENSFLMAFDTKKENYIMVSLVENHKKTGKTATELAKNLIPELQKLQYTEK